MRMFRVERPTVDSDIRPVAVLRDVRFRDHVTFAAERDDHVSVMPMRWCTQHRTLNDETLKAIRAQWVLSQLPLTKFLPSSFHNGAHQPIIAVISMAGARNGAHPIAIASAIIPSMRPVDLRFESLRLPASSSTTTE
jgi:hypothetical protein